MVFKLIRGIPIFYHPLKNTKLISCLFIVALLTGAMACSTKKNTFTRRVYHNLTAHYNAYYNGKEALNEAVLELSKKSKDNYAKVLPVFPYGSKEDAQSMYGLLDRAIEKGSKVIQKHSIYIKRVEHVKWIDDAYFLIGRAYLYKQEYDLAATTFSFIRERYKGNPIVYQAILYQIRTYTQQGKFSQAEALISAVEKRVEKNKATRNVEKMFPLVMADYYLQQEEYGKSIEFLEQAIRLNKNKRVKTRTTFILAQVYQKTGNLGKATEYYRKVLGYNPVYEMEFACKINMAKCYDAAAGDSRDIVKTLRKMLRDEKNKDFLDQIYYALAEVYLQEKNMTEAIANLKLSARSSVSNNYQKGISYLKLGDIYYADEDYRQAQLFYDSAFQSLPKDYPNLSLIESKTNTLTDLVKNMDVVLLEDSLQMMGRLPYNERIQKIDDIILAIIREEERKKQEEIDRLNALSNLQQMGFQDQNAGGGKWYFENPQTISFGMSEFKKKWGNRKLEDLWRLSNKVAVDFGYTDDGSQEGDSVAADSSDAYVFDPKDRNAYLKVIPTTPEAFAKSDDKIKEALFNIGTIYKDGLGDYDKSIEAFEKLMSRFPDNKYLLTTYYYLYRIYDDEENISKANYYKDLIISKYPDSDYARILNDPDYYQKLDSISGIEEKFYSGTYTDYQAGNYLQVIRKADSAIAHFADLTLIPKFYYLKAVSGAKLYGDSTMLDPLNTIVTKYPSSEVVPLARALISMLTGTTVNNTTQMSDSGNNVQTDVAENSPYVYDPEGFHFYICVYDAVKVKLSEVKSLYSDHNASLFKLDKLSVNSMYLNTDQQMITVNRFDNKNKAMDYYNTVRNNPAIMAKLVPAEINHFVVSANNYTTFYRLKDINQYMDFFSKNYLNQ